MIMKRRKSMNSQMLENARLYEDRVKMSIDKSVRPSYHLTAPVGWLNDPNGFSYYQGCYHLFFQYYPYASHWGYIYWGHAISDDLVRWEYLPAALAPDMEYDKHGCFSGSAALMDNGRQLLIYTGVKREETPDHVVRERQTQCIAVGDGIDYVKYEKNPVIDSDQIPQGGSPFDFRDPHIVIRPEGGYSCYIAGRDESEMAQILRYDSDDGYQWRYVNVLVRNNGQFGKMWECPDYFELDGEQILIVSAMDMLPIGIEFMSGNHAVCLTRETDSETGSFTIKEGRLIDHGIDFYAPQTLRTPDGRRVMIGWMQNVDALSIREPNAPWAGQMTVPRELHMRNGRLYQMPIQELDNYRNNKTMLEHIIISDADVKESANRSGCILPGIKGRTIDLQLRIRPAGEAIYRSFEMRMAQNDDYYTSLRFLPEEASLLIDRTFSGTRRGILHQSQCRIDSDVRDLHLRVLIDRYSVEVFIEDGYKVMSATMYTVESAERITFHAEGAVRLDLIKYDICV